MGEIFLSFLSGIVITLLTREFKFYFDKQTIFNKGTKYGLEQAQLLYPQMQMTLQRSTHGMYITTIVNDGPVSNG